MCIYNKKIQENANYQIITIVRIPIAQQKQWNCTNC